MNDTNTIPEDRFTRARRLAREAEAREEAELDVYQRAEIRREIARQRAEEPE